MRRLAVACAAAASICGGALAVAGGAASRGSHPRRAERWRADPWRAYWTDVNSGSGIQFISSRIGFALADQPVNSLDGLLSAPIGPTVTWPSPTLLVSRDGGRSWRRSLSAPAGFWGFAFADRWHGLAVGVTQLYRTADGGRHWQQISEPAQPLVRVAYTGGYEAAGLTTGGRLVWTRDGGTSWHPGAWTGDGRALCSTGNEVLVADRHGGVWRSKDPGYPFTRVARGRPRPIEYSDWWVDLSCSSDNAVELVQAFGEAAGAGVRTLVRQSTNGGFTWRRVSEIDSLGGQLDEGAPLPVEAVAVGTRTACALAYPRSPTLEIRCTSNAGHSFQRARAPVMARSRYPSVRLLGVRFLGPALGWLVIDDVIVDDRRPARYQTQVWRTGDGGASWQVISEGRRQRIPKL